MRRFVMIGLVLVVAGAMTVGRWSAEQTERLVIERSAAFTALFVDSYVSHYVDGVEQGGTLTAADVEGLDRLIDDTALGDDIVSMKIWTPDGRILYSTDPALIGMRYPDNAELAPALNGEVTARITDLEEPENRLERRSHDRLLETYAPARIGDRGDIGAVVEFYQLPDDLERELADATARTWLMVGGSMIVTFAVLAAFFVHVSNTIGRQQGELDRRLQQIHELNGRIRTAVSSAAASNERMLRRIAAELHDGPAQQLGAVLLELEPHDPPTREANTRSAVETALRDLRRIASGVRAPDLSSLSTCEAIGQAAHAHHRNTGHPVDLAVDRCVDRTPLPIRIALYRVVQESLRNASRHGGGNGLSVRAMCRDGEVTLAVSDDGAGFDPTIPTTDDHLGLIVMRERVESFGGDFAVSSRLGHGTVVAARIPLNVYGPQ